MFRFFRKIRINLLAQGRIARYLTYAVGEIVLVVIGILIAVQLNNWNEERKNRITERPIIESFVTDLHEDLHLMDKVIEFNELKMARLDSLLAYAGTDINAMDDQNQLYYLVRGTITNKTEFSNQDRNLMKMKNLNAGIIRSHVADSIAFFEKNIERMEGQGKTYAQTIVDARVLMTRLFKFYYVNDKEYFDAATGKFTGKQFPPINPDVALQDEFFNLVYIINLVTRNYLAERHLGGHYKQTQRLIAFLEKEYDLKPVSEVSED